MKNMIKFKRKLVKEKKNDKMEKSIKKFSNFVNDFLTESIDDVTTYKILNEKNYKYVSDPRFTEKKSLMADILKNCGPAVTNLLKSKGIDYPVKAVASSRKDTVVEFIGEEITGEKLGLFMYGMRDVTINSFGGGGVVINEESEDFEFVPYIWFDLHYSYSHGSPWTSARGSNGCSLFLPNEKSSNIYYDIIGKTMLTDTEAQKRRDWQ